MSRARNSASADDVAKVLRGSMAHLDDSTLVGDSEQLVEKHVEVMANLLKITQRPTQRVLAQGARLAFKVEEGLAKRFGERLAWAFSYIRGKKKSATSGRKLRPCVRRLLDLLR